MKATLAVTLAAMFVAAAVAGAAATPLPKGFTIVPGSQSPDGKLGVIAPDVADAKLTKDSHDNRLVELATGKVLATLVSPTAAVHQDDADFAPHWSADGSLLLWYVDGK